MGVDYYSCYNCGEVSSEYDFPGCGTAIGDAEFESICNSCIRKHTRGMLINCEGMYLFGLEYKDDAGHSSAAGQSKKKFMVITLPWNLIPALADRMCSGLTRGMVAFLDTEGYAANRRHRDVPRLPMPTNMDVFMKFTTAKQQHDGYTFDDARMFHTKDQLLLACNKIVQVDEARYTTPDPLRDACLRVDFPTEARFRQFDALVSTCFVKFGIPAVLVRLVILYTREQHVDRAAIEKAATPAIQKRQKLTIQLKELRAKHQAECKAITDQIDSAKAEEAHAKRGIVAYKTFVQNEQKTYTDQFVDTVWNDAVASAKSRKTMFPGPIVNMNTSAVRVNVSSSESEEADTDDEDNDLDDSHAVDDVDGEDDVSSIDASSASGSSDPMPNHEKVGSKRKRV